MVAVVIIINYNGRENIVNNQRNEHVNYFNVLNQAGSQQVKAVTYELIVFDEIITNQNKNNQYQHKH